MPRVGDWMKLNCGDRVREHEGRHIGRVETIEHGAFVWVRWDDRSLSHFRLNEVIRVRDDESDNDADTFSDKNTWRYKK